LYCVTQQLYDCSRYVPTYCIVLHSSCMTAVGMYQLIVLCYTAAVWLQSVCTNLMYWVTQQLYDCSRYVPTYCTVLHSSCMTAVSMYQIIVLYYTAAVWLQSVCTNLLYCVTHQLFECSRYVPTYCTVLHSSCTTAVGMYQLIVLCYTAAVWLQSVCTNLLYCVTQQMYDCSRYVPTYCTVLHSSCLNAVGMYQHIVLCYTAAVWLQSVCTILLYCVTQQLYDCSRYVPTYCIVLHSSCKTAVGMYQRIVLCYTAAVWLQSVCTKLLYCVTQQLYDCSRYVPTYCIVLHSSCMTAVGMYQLIVLCYTAAVWMQSVCTNFVYCVTEQLYECSRYVPT